MKNERIFQFFATLGPIGFLPAPGTCATLVTMIALYCVPHTTGLHYLGFIGAVFILSWIFIKRALRFFVDNDPSQIVLDEVIGCLITFYAVPISGLSLAIGFLLFRFFDISKIGPIRWFERIKGTSGIILDDVVAGIISNIILRLILYAS